MGRYYLLDMSQYEKIVNKWNIQNKQDDIITINRAIKGDIGINEYIHRNELIKDYSLLKNTQPEDITQTYIRHGAMQYIKKLLESKGVKIE